MLLLTIQKKILRLPYANGDPSASSTIKSNSVLTNKRLQLLNLSYFFYSLSFYFCLLYFYVFFLIFYFSSSILFYWFFPFPFVFYRYFFNLIQFFFNFLMFCFCFFLFFLGFLLLFFSIFSFSFVDDLMTIFLNTSMSDRSGNIFVKHDPSSAQWLSSSSW